MLKEINFKNGIRGEDIEKNFKYLEEVQKREAIRIGGAGIVSGLDINILENKSITVSDGLIIGKDGQEIFVKGSTLRPFSIEPISRTSERMIVNEQGEITLPYRPYSQIRRAFFSTRHYNDLYPTQELIIRSAIDGTSIRAIAINGTSVTLNAGEWAGKYVYVDYLYARNRMDTVIYDPSRGVRLISGTMTTSLSQADAEDYEGSFILGMVETSIDNETTLVVHQASRQDRNLYTGEDGSLYINGQPYRRFYFTPPDDPREYDILFDLDESKIYAYHKTADGFEWQLVSREDIVPQTEIKIFSPNECPDDLQTFRLDEEERNMFFIPGQNQVQIIIDNAPIMADQFEEIVSEEIADANNGRGFKLKEPLSKKTYVEMRVMNPIKTSPLNKVYQRTAVFVKEGIAYKDSNIVNNVFYSTIPFVAGENQLEVYMNGARLIRNIDFIEINEDLSAATSGVCNHFQILKDVPNGQVIEMRIMRNVYSYDHISEILENSVKNIKDTIAGAQLLQDKMQEDFLIMQEAVDSEREANEHRIGKIEGSIKEIKTVTDGLDNYVSKQDKISTSQVDNSFAEKLYKESFERTFVGRSIVQLDDVKVNDYMIVYLVKSDNSRPLFKGLDYSVSASGNGVVVAVDEDLIESETTVFISGIKLGR